MSNVYQFPKASMQDVTEAAKNATEDELFIQQLHSLPTIEQELWRASLDLACKLLKAGYAYDIDVTKRRSGQA
ncbi:MAG: hypothetical protein KJ958_14785 [Gammaproteobacteria bacterium]|nr:hypothetical protein [Gammaproteobacteria bacterium]